MEARRETSDGFAPRPDQSGTPCHSSPSGARRGLPGGGAPHLPRRARPPVGSPAGPLHPSLRPSHQPKPGSPLRLAIGRPPHPGPTSCLRAAPLAPRQLGRQARVHQEPSHGHLRRRPGHGAILGRPQRHRLFLEMALPGADGAASIRGHDRLLDRRQYVGPRRRTDAQLVGFPPAVHAGRAADPGRRSVLAGRRRAQPRPRLAHQAGLDRLHMGLMGA
mmetsp:Transcript_33952/g.109680  ORF Transcript_33952/g.109680 Transcript_33952/m.109680 type:complete len:219 (-) Transcript_33952:2022-2678(-)